MAKKGQIFRRYSAEFKIGVIMDMRDHHLGLRETARKYEVTHAVILKWERRSNERKTRQSLFR